MQQAPPCPQRPHLFAEANCPHASLILSLSPGPWPQSLNWFLHFQALLHSILCCALKARLSSLTVLDKSFGNDDGCGHYFSCSDDFIDICIHKNLSDWLFEMCAVFCMSIIQIKEKDLHGSDPTILWFNNLQWLSCPVQTSYLGTCYDSYVNHFLHTISLLSRSIATSYMGAVPM